MELPHYERTVLINTTAEALSNLLGKKCEVEYVYMNEVHHLRATSGNSKVMTMITEAAMGHTTVEILATEMHAAITTSTNRDVTV